MKNLSKKIVIYILIGFVTFSGTSMTYYKSVHAFEWVGGAISFVEAMKWLLGTLGVLGGVAITHDLWEEYADDFEEWALDAGNTQEQITQWQAKLCTGILDKGSSVWIAFKTWVSHLITDNNSSGISGTFVGDSSDVISSIDDLLSIELTSYPNEAPYNNSTITHTYICYYLLDGTMPYYNIVFWTSNGNNYNVTLDSNGNLSSGYSNTIYINFIPNSYSPWRWGAANTSVPSGSRVVDRQVYISDNIINNWSYPVTLLPVSGSSSLGTLHTINDARQEQFDLISRITGNEADDEVSIPMPGVGDSDDAISNDAYDDIIDRVNNGDITIDEAVEEIQELLKVIVYDTVTDDVIPVAPDPDDPTKNENKDDVIKQNKDNMGFTLGGLENVFPFCIPWDIYAFMGILEAPPDTPVFQFPFRDPKTKQDVLYTIDLSPFNPVASVVRYGCDLIFIIGLAMATRKLIGAGGGD